MQYKTDLNAGTVVTFAGGSLTETATLLWAARIGEDWLLVTDRSPFHPVSLSWPDQPGDHGHVVLAGSETFDVIDSLTGVVDATAGMLLTEADATALPRGQENLHAVVLHRVRSPLDLSAQIGTSVMLHVDAARREALSLQHSGVHLAALALNQAAAGFWTKDYPDLDTLGAPNLDKAAVAASEITAEASLDTYRIGKSLRKKGFDRDAFTENLPARAAAINQLLTGMLAEGADVTLTPAEGPLDGRRIWSTRLNGTEATMPCGGTHLPALCRIAEIKVDLTPADEGFAMRTKTRLK